MTYSEPAPIRRTRSLVLTAVIVSATLVGVVSCQTTDYPPTSSPSAGPPPTTAPHGDAHEPPDQPERGQPDRTAGPTTPQRTPLGEADGALPDGATVFDDQYPGVANLDPGLLQAIREAATAAADDGVEFVVNSGWRSEEYQDQLLRQAVSEYGSKEQAAQWVATPDTSFHVSGNAIDIGPFKATAWLSEHGAAYGLCQIYGNEPWHFELRLAAVDHGCPPMYSDPSQDPRMQR